MKDIVIFGCGGLGREVLFQLQEQNKISAEYNILGFCDDNASLHGKSLSDYPVLGGSEYLLNYDSPLCVVIAVGKPHIRRLIYNKISENKNICFPTVTAPGAVCSDRVKIGKGCIIGFFSCMTVDIEIGDFALISNHCNVGHDAVLGDFVTLYPAVHVSGNVHIGTECEIGVGSNIIQGLSLGDRTVIGAGAAVVSDIEGDCTAVGVPARVIRQNRI
ncbi:MAG: acetyltransferase [Clostridia bacterium]|nr:acetyltransferase [Clostridia bacterium]